MSILQGRAIFHMCIEVYSRQNPICILYEQEKILFRNPTTFDAQYTLLVRNLGYTPIYDLLCLYPRNLITLHHDTGYLTPNLPTFRTFATGFGKSAPFSQSKHDNHEVVASIANPNNPLIDIPNLAGYWNPENFNEYYLPNQVKENLNSSYDAFKRYSFSGFGMHLKEPILPGKSHWFRWMISTRDTGAKMENCFLCPIVYHELVSPLDVRNTISETILNEHSIVNEWKDREPEKYKKIVNFTKGLNAIIDDFGLRDDRQVEVQYYELSVRTGDPSKQFLLNHSSQGDIRMRSKSPRLIQPQRKNGKVESGVQQPVYEWKSGTLLHPHNPWRNKGFSLRIALGYNRVSSANE